MPAVSLAEVDAAATALGRLLQSLGLLVASAESCTGGLIARSLTETAGSSSWFERGFVTYSNAAKQECLDVAPDALRAHGAVSEPVARQMAQGALRHSHAALALAVTGVAGPTGGAPDKSVGTVCFGWALRADAGQGDPLVRSETVHFQGDRAAVRLQSALHALNRAERLLRAELADRPPRA